MKRILLIISLFIFFLAGAQNKKVMTLQDVIALAKIQSPSAILAKTKFNNNYWQYRIFKTSTLPTLSLEGSLPNYSQSIRKITFFDGSDFFIKSRYANYDATLSIRKKIGLTGGNIFVSSGLQQLVFYEPGKYTTLLSTPVNVGFQQPLFAYNDYHWQNKIEPLKYKEAKQQYLEDMEDISEKASNIFFDLLLAQANFKLDEINRQLYDSLYRISKGRYEIGKIAENDLLQMELNKLNAEVQASQSQIDLQAKGFMMKSFLGIKDGSEIELVSDLSTIIFFKVDLEKAKSAAIQNRPSLIDRQVQLLQAQSEVIRAKRENRFAVNLFGSYGLTQSAGSYLGSGTINDVYKDPLPQQQVLVGIQIPIIDWGKARAQIKMAMSNQELVQTTVEQNEVDFEQEIFLKVMQFNMQKQQLTIAAKSDTIAQKSFEIAKYRFLTGKIDIESLTLTQRAKETAHNAFYSALKNYWAGYFEIRKITLYDFEKDHPLEVDFNSLIK